MNGADERDQSVERLLRQSLRTPARGATDACLDAEMLAAWADGGLTGPDLKHAEAHLAACDRCQAVVGALVRTEVAAEAEPEPFPRRWLAWLVPLTAAAAAVAIWVAVPRDRAQTTPPASAVADARGAAEAVPETQPPQPSPVAGAVNGDSVRKIEAPSTETETRERFTYADRMETDRLAAGRSNAVGASDAAERRDNANQAALATGALAAASPPPPAPAASSAPAVAAVEPTARAALEAGPATSALIVIASPNPAVRWRLAESTVEYSSDGGTTWAAALTEAGVSPVAGTSPTPAVCWVVGRGGGVWLSADGRPFARISFPEATDLTAVRARDARTALVSTSDGRIFGTTDGGLTWTLRPLQDFQTAPF